MVRTDSDSEARTPEQTGTFKATVAAAAAAGGIRLLGAEITSASRLTNPAPASVSQTGHCQEAVLVQLLGLPAIWFFMQGKEETDDAYVDGHISNVGSRIAGTVGSQSWSPIINWSKPVRLWRQT